MERLAAFSRVITFDKRGTGLSDPVPVAELPTLEQRMDDLRVVMDAAGSERAVVVGVSEGGPHGRRGRGLPLAGAVDAHDAVVTRQLVRFRGRSVQAHR